LAASLVPSPRVGAVARPIRDWISVFKPRILVLLVAVAVVSGLVGAREGVPWGSIALLAMSGTIASASASLLNNYRDRDIDAIMDRTRTRPLATGRINARAALIVGILLLVSGTVLALLVNVWSGVFVLSGALIYAVVYSYGLKRRTAWNIVIGGLAGSCAVLAGWSAVSTDFNTAAILIAAILFLWTPCHFWSFALVHQESYRKAKVPMLPVVAGEKKTSGYVLLHAVLLLLVSVLLYVFSDLGIVYLVGALICSLVFVTTSFRLFRSFDRGRAWRNYKLSGVYLLGLFASMLLATLVR